MLVGRTMRRNRQNEELLRQLKLSSTTRIIEQLSGFADMQRQIQERILALTSVRFSQPLKEISALSQAFSQSREIYRISQAATEALRLQLVPVLSSMDAISKTIATSIAATRIAFDSLGGLDLIQRFRERVDLDEETVEAFNAAGWPIAPSMPQCLRQRVVELYKAGKAAYTSQTILGYYRRESHTHLVQAVEGWRDNSLFKSRMHIINDALTAHRRGLYTLSVPALIPQIEGVLNDYVWACGLHTRFGKINEVYKVVIGDPYAHDLSTWTIAMTLLHHLQTNTYVFTDFETELEKSVRQRLTTRHTVLHGITTNYGKPIHSLRAFVLLDSLSALEISDE